MVYEPTGISSASFTWAYSCYYIQVEGWLIGIEGICDHSTIYHSFFFFFKQILDRKPFLIYIYLKYIYMYVYFFPSNSGLPFLSPDRVFKKIFFLVDCTSQNATAFFF